MDFFCRSTLISCILLVLTPTFSSAMQVGCAYLRSGEKNWVPLPRSGNTFTKSESDSSIELLMDRGQSTFSYYQYFQGQQNQYILYQMSCTSTHQCSALELERTSGEEQKTNLNILQSAEGVSAALKNKTVLFHPKTTGKPNYVFMDPESPKKGFELKCY